MSRSNQLPNLDKLFRDDDEQDFTPQGGSNLAAIFGTPQKPESSSLRPASQKKSSSGRSTPQSTSSPSPSSKTEVIIAKVVHAYKLQNGQYSLIGKIGIALTGNTSTRTYLLILYKTKQEHISVVALTPEFVYTIGENNYGSYYDGNNENWSIMFESSEGAIEFAREIGLAKYFLRQGKLEDSVFLQDLTPVKKGNGEEDTLTAKENDEIEIKCMIISSITQPLKLANIPVQSMRVQISSDNNWERSLLDVQKGLKRILILPPSKQISLGPGYPREKDVALEIEIIDIIKQEIKRIPSPKLPAASGKASLISRMAKMGQSMLPKLPTSTTTDSEDTEEEVPVKSPNRRLRGSQSQVDTLQKPANGANGSPSSGGTTPIQTAAVLGQRNLVTSSVGSPHGSLVPAAAFAHPWTPQLQQQQFISGLDGQLYPLQAPITPQLPMDPNLNVFLSESRTHNAEIRMGMSKIADNVQKLLDKFHVLEVQNAASPNNEKALEASLKMLMSLNLGKNEEIPHQGSSRASENGSSSLESRERVKSLEDELRTTKTLLTEGSSKLEKLKDERKDFENEKREVRERIQRLESSLADAQSALQGSLSDVKQANDVMIKQQKENATLEARMITLVAEKSLLEKKLGNRDKDFDKGSEIKQIMNKTYQTLVGKFTETSYTTEYIKSTVASTIRNITLQVLKEGREDSHSSDAEMKESEGESRTDGILMAGDDESLTLPDIDRVSDHKMDTISGSLEEPPPIPPMDLDIGDDWSEITIRD